MCCVIPTAPYCPGVSWPHGVAALGPGGTPVTLIFSPSSALALRRGTWIWRQTTPLHLSLSLSVPAELGPG